MSKLFKRSRKTFVRLIKLIFLSAFAGNLKSIWHIGKPTPSGTRFLICLARCQYQITPQCRVGGLKQTEIIRVSKSPKVVLILNVLEYSRLFCQMKLRIMMTLWLFRWQFWRWPNGKLINYQLDVLHKSGISSESIFIHSNSVWWI